MKYVPGILLILLFLTLPRLVWAEEVAADGGNGEPSTAQTDPDASEKDKDADEKKKKEGEEEEEPECE